MIHFTSSIVRCFNESILDMFLTFFLKCLYTLKISLTNHYNIYGRFFLKIGKSIFLNISLNSFSYIPSPIFYFQQDKVFSIFSLLPPPPLALFHSPFSNPPPSLSIPLLSRKVSFTSSI